MLEDCGYGSAINSDEGGRLRLVYGLDRQELKIHLGTYESL